MTTEEIVNTLKKLKAGIWADESAEAIAIILDEYLDRENDAQDNFPGLTRFYEVADNIIETASGKKKKKLPDELYEAAGEHEMVTNHDGDIYSNVAIWRAFIAGAEWQKENMLRKTTEGQIENGEDYMRIKCLCMGCAPEQDGGIVKIIIVKENE